MGRPGARAPGRSGRARRRSARSTARVLTEDEIGKGYELSKDQLIPVSDDELADLPLPAAKAIDVVAFVPQGVCRKSRAVPPVSGAWPRRAGKRPS
ncbi:Ku protein [Streptomyces cavernae]|uniref:Ku protein n=1 Tax=Streptomyces cavernae TaxID=2259034 RepID=UPI0030B8233D